MSEDTNKRNIRNNHQYTGYFQIQEAITKTLLVGWQQDFKGSLETQRKAEMPCLGIPPAEALQPSPTPPFTPTLLHEQFELLTFP